MATRYRRLGVLIGGAVLALLMSLNVGISQGGLQVTPTSWDFGNVAVGLCSSAKSFTVSNTSPRNLSVTASTALPFKVISQNPVTIPAGQNRTFDVQFCPTSTGTFTGQVTFTATGVASVSASLSGSSGQQKFRLIVTKTGTGSGTVKSDDGKINCGNACTAEYDPNTRVTLRAEAASGSAFDGWSGACTGMATTCEVIMNADKTVTASYMPGVTLNVQKLGTGSGTVKSDPPGIDCGTDCIESYPKDREVKLIATPDSDSAVSKWESCDSVSENTCQLKVSRDKTVKVTFLRSVPVCYYRSGTDGTAQVEGTARRDVCQPLDPVELFSEVIIRGDGDGNFANGPTACPEAGCGDDKITGTDGDDIIFGDDGLGGARGTGHDRIVAGKGNDIINGEAGNDIIFGGDDNDIIDGGPGNDVIDSGFGVDEVSGGGGNDTFIIRAGNPDAGTGTTTIICTQNPGESGRVLVRGNFKSRIPFGTYRNRETTVIIEDRSVNYSSPMIYEVMTGPGKCVIRRG